MSKLTTREIMELRTECTRLSQFGEGQWARFVGYALEMLPRILDHVIEQEAAIRQMREVLELSEQLNKARMDCSKCHINHCYEHGEEVIALHNKHQAILSSEYGQRTYEQVKKMKEALSRATTLVAMIETKQKSFDAKCKLEALNIMHEALKEAGT